MAWTWTASTCPGLAPTTRSGPVAGLTKGKRTVSGDSLDAVEEIRPSLQLISHSTVTTSPGRTSVTQASVADKAYFRFPAFGMMRAASIAAPSMEDQLKSCRHGSNARSTRLTSAESTRARATVTVSAANTLEMA